MKTILQIAEEEGAYFGVGYVANGEVLFRKADLECFAARIQAKLWREAEQTARNLHEQGFNGLGIASAFGSRALELECKSASAEATIADQINEGRI